LAKASFAVRSTATKVQLAFLGADFGYVDVDVTDGVALEGLLGGLIVGDLGQAADPVSLEATVQGRARQVRDRRLQRIETVIERQKRVLAEGATTIASSPAVSTVERTVFEPIGARG
jgi:hypothetical protein